MDHCEQTLKRALNKSVLSHKGQMNYPKCSNDRCTHNDRLDCKASGQDEDIVCKQGKADAIKALSSKHEITVTLT